MLKMYVYGAENLLKERENDMKKTELKDPHGKYSRTCYTKEELDDKQVCAWCGSRSKNDGLFEYDDCGKLFCCKACYVNYFSLDV